MKPIIVTGSIISILGQHSNSTELSPANWPAELRTQAETRVTANGIRGTVTAVVIDPTTGQKHSCETPGVLLSGAAY